MFLYIYIYIYIYLRSLRIQSLFIASLNLFRDVSAETISNLLGSGAISAKSENSITGLEVLFFDLPLHISSNFTILRLRKLVLIEDNSPIQRFFLFFQFYHSILQL